MIDNPIEDSTPPKCAVFACYETTTGLDLAKNLKQALEKRNTLAFVADQDLPKFIKQGIEWRTYVDRLIASVKTFIVILSIDLVSGEMLRELKLAFERNKREPNFAIIIAHSRNVSRTSNDILSSTGIDTAKFNQIDFATQEELARIITSMLDESGAVIEPPALPRVPSTLDQDKYSTGQAAALIGVSFITIKRWIYSNKVKATKDDQGWWQIPREEVLRMKEQLTATAAPRTIDQEIIDLVRAKTVAYLRELQVALEESYLHRDTTAALNRLVPATLSTKDKYRNRWYFLKENQWSGVANLAKQKSELVKAYVKHPRRFEYNSTVYLDYSEYLVERALLDAGYTVTAKDAYYFNGASYRPNDSAGRPTDLDFIAYTPKEGGIFIGIQVKNKMESPRLEEVQQLLEICRALHLHPVLVARIIHPLTFDLMKSNQGFAIECKRYFLRPPFPPETFNAITSIGIPIGVYRRPPDFLIRAFLALPGRMVGASTAE